MIWFFCTCPLWPMTSDMHWNNLSPNVKGVGWKSATPSMSPWLCCCQKQRSKYLRVLLTRDEEMQREMDRQFGAASAVQRGLCQTEGGDSSAKTQSSQFRVLFHCISTKKSQIYMTKNKKKEKIITKVAGLRHSGMGFDICRALRVEALLLALNAASWDVSGILLGCPKSASLWRFFGIA